MYKSVVCTDNNIAMKKGRPLVMLTGLGKINMYNIVVYSHLRIKGSIYIQLHAAADNQK